jgi:hypothetical protein
MLRRDSLDAIVADVTVQPFQSRPPASCAPIRAFDVYRAAEHCPLDVFDGR